jgi:hypothetical protein
MSWYYKERPYREITDPSLEGFVYLITYVDPKTKEIKKYIGKKNFHSIRKIAKGKKELAKMTDKRSSKKKIVKKESNWKTYKSSNDFLKKQSETNLKKEILVFCHTKMELTYQEVKFQFIYGVLETNEWLNASILGRFFKAK